MGHIQKEYFGPYSSRKSIKKAENLSCNRNERNMWQIAKMSKFNSKYQGSELLIFTNLCKPSSSSYSCTELETVVIAQHMVSFRRKCKANLKQVREVQLGEWLINVQMLLTVGGIRLCGGHQTIFPGQSSRTASINFKFVCSWDTMKTNPQD